MKRNAGSIVVFEYLILITLLWPTDGSAQGFMDSFSSTSRPVAWTVHETSQGNFDIVDGVYVAMGNDPTIGDQAMTSLVYSHTYSDVSVEARTSIVGAGTVALLGRFDPAALTGYGGSLDTNGLLTIFRTDGNVHDIPSQTLASVNIPHSSTDDMRLDLDLLRNQITLTAWPVDVDSVWSTGDFNGDGRTDSSDLIEALADGGYEQGSRTAAAVVPEPSSTSLVVVALAGLLVTTRKSMVRRNN